MTANAKNLVSDLLPCPFCGSIELSILDEDDCPWVECNVCVGSTTAADSIEQCIENWNTRAPMLAQAGDAVSGSWISGYPPKRFGREWFIAKLKRGDKIVLRALPEDYTSDFTTGDDTYINKERIECWMQFPDDAVSEPIGYISNGDALILASQDGRAFITPHKSHVQCVPVYTTPHRDDGKVARDAEPTADDLAELSQILVDFDDCEETQASDKTLHRLVELGFLECIRYVITAKGNAAIKEQQS